ncbi:MAG TPA: aldo/keto reductase [Holophagaceae bacterium]|jgi:aryl-alcohol dehydrogenase-like predicted oxidoreductase|nr:aldo/keto reductase [Holophagaceae bacterium]
MTPSSLGFGTYLGAPSAAADEGYAAAARRFFELGGTAFDTAANYRSGRSERALGSVLPGLPRGSFFISTKAGYLPMSDGETRESPGAWFDRVLRGPGILADDEVVDGCHALTPCYLAHQLEVSRRALGLETIDLFHLHNPEQQLPALGVEAFYAVIAKAFDACEGFRSEGRIRFYGVATWDGLRVPPGAENHLDLARLWHLAESIGGPRHGFRWVQAPLNLGMPEAFTEPTQELDGQRLTLLEAAQGLGISVQTSASMLQARILGSVEAQRGTLAKALPGCVTAAQIALQFTRSCPGVTTALCGMGRVVHVEENLPVLALPKADPDALRSLFA